jgi:hypothetical protein
MSPVRNKGFVLVLVITAIALIGVIMFVLTTSANDLQFQSNRAYLQAVEHNLTASGLAWAKRHIGNGKTGISDGPTSLDVSDLNVRGSSLAVTVGTPGDEEVEVEISTSCTRGRQTRRHADKYRVKL